MSFRFFLILLLTLALDSCSNHVSKSVPTREQTDNYKLLCSGWKNDSIGNCRTGRTVNISKQIIAYYNKLRVDSIQILSDLGQPDYKTHDSLSNYLTYGYRLFPICDFHIANDSSACQLNIIFGNRKNINFLRCQ